MRGPWAHPRSRGENSNVGPGAPVAFGSSPLTRGKPQLGADCGGKRRLIPAHAGKTRTTAQRSMTLPAHPRSRGENIWSPCMPRALSGSSPLTRGKLAGGNADTFKSGLIPAHAGKTRWTSTRPRLTTAHPRSRGENSLRSILRLRRCGSSPLTRGKLHRNNPRQRRVRLIPAHAGKTRPPWPGGYGQAAHPRSRGENCSRHVV